ncbi:hypothetical protein L873DRAFT_1795601 [Choiromyces venosus 120613-1]|uniref:RRM domain-containing protein n=1 Tax=Choiromyces venosus 120613-1 TaxID=1336337 RepID=A0A3N4IZ13_9PEZI|nr:hypothetical protein L873DRAFT_1795601 [Choiromyces venosus 120613-1]
MRRRGKTMSNLNDEDDHLPSFLDSLPLNLGRGTSRQFSRVLFNQSQEVEIKDSESDNDTEFFVPHEGNSATMLAEGGLQMTQAELDFDILEVGIETGPEDLAARGLPSACVFVANLAATQTDEELTKSLQSHFGKYGRLHVKIRRDSKGNPYSFCQFESDEVARRAIREGRARIIDSSCRPIRCEPAKVNRTLMLSKNDSSFFHRQEVVDMLHGFGPLESVEFADGSSTMPLFGLTSGQKCFVRFQFRQDAVDGFQSLRLNSRWVSDWTSNFSAHNMSMALHSELPIEIDPFSIYIGRLSPQTTDRELRSRFSAHGRIVDCNIRKKQSKLGSGINTFAFIRYETEEMASAALAAEIGSEFMGRNLHVQKREIHKKPQFIGVPGGYRNQQETNLTTQTSTEPEIPIMSPQYPLYQEYHFQAVPLAPTLNYPCSIPTGQMEPERRYSVANPMIPIMPQFHVMNYHNHYGSSVMASRHPGNFPVATHPFTQNPINGYSFPPHNPFAPLYHNPGQGYNIPSQGFAGADAMYGSWGTPRQRRTSTGNPSVRSEPVSPRTRVNNVKMENLSHPNISETPNTQPPLLNEYPIQQPSPSQSHYDFYCGPFPPPHFSNGYPFVPQPPSLVDMRRDSVMSTGYDPIPPQYVGSQYESYASLFPPQQYAATGENDN